MKDFSPFQVLYRHWPLVPGGVERKTPEWSVTRPGFEISVYKTQITDFTA